MPQNTKQTLTWNQAQSWFRNRLKPNDKKVHQSFRRTKRRDLPVRTPLPNYFAFTAQVFKLLSDERRLVLKLAGLHLLLTIVIAGLMSQTDYQALSGLLKDATEQTFGASGNLAASLVLFTTALGGGISQGASQVQQFILATLNLLTWLVIVWLLRQRLNGKAVKLRDGLYNASTPLIPTLIIVLLATLQLLPVSFGALAFSAALENGVLLGGIETAMFAAAAVMLGLLSLYWLSATIIAAVVVTLPGTYPLAALRAAYGVVLGRRLSVILRLLWLGILTIVAWALVLVPIILLDGVIQQDWLPLVPLTVQMLSTLTVILTSTYLYTLYRRMIDEPA